MNTKSQRSSAFTLVELIVVITILAILGTIGFLSLQGYSKSARESGRTSDLATLSKGLDGIVAAGMTLPRPDSTMVTLTASGTVIGYQGYAGKNVLSVAGVGGKMQDPLDGLHYTYLINAAGTRHQVLALYEDAALAAGGLITPAYAGAYDLRAPGSR
jgi:prepilin-type N-terminal cleavage/methylation domain-containing protein